MIDSMTISINIIEIIIKIDSFMNAMTDDLRDGDINMDIKIWHTKSYKYVFYGFTVKYIYRYKVYDLNFCRQTTIKTLK